MSLVHVKGLQELDKFLQELPVRLEKNVLRGALRAGAKVIQQEAKLNINSVSGETAASIKVRSNAQGGKVTASVYSRYFVAPFLEWGTRPHTITAQLGGALAFGGSLRWSVEHPGIAPYGSKTTIGPHAFLRPALDLRAQDAVVEVGIYMRARLATKHGLDTADIVIGEDQ